MSLRLLQCVVLPVVFASTSYADEVSDRQKKVAGETLNKVEVRKGAVVETDNLIVAADLPEAKAKAVAETLQKAYRVARKALQYDAKEEPWKGKLTLYILPDSRTFKKFLRLVAGVKPEEPYHVAVRGDEQYAVSGAEFGEKATEADIAAEAAPLVGVALLLAKAGSNTPVPEWVRMGFGRAAALRAEGTASKRFTTYRATARALVLGGGGKFPAPIADVWSGTRKDADILAVSLMDYIAFGPGSPNFPKFLVGLRPNENGDPPAITAVLEAAMWKEPMLDAAWRKWVQAGIPVK
jgi:hypothetical protein